MKVVWSGLLLWISALVYFSGCEQPLNPVSQGELAFSVDTVKFDSLFVNFQSPSERLSVYNRTNRDMQINRIWLESAGDSEYELVVDGIRSNDVSDLVIAEGDSLRIFVTLTSELRDNFSEEFIAFQVGDEIQRILIRAFVLDAYFFQARLNVDSLTISGFSFTRDTILTSEKPIIFDGPIVIRQGVRVSIEPGTEIFFTPHKVELPQGNGTSTFVFFSTLLVNGTLRAVGAPDMPITFQGTRLDEDFAENPAQWRGIVFSQTSSDNFLQHALIKNGLFGVEVDSISNGRRPRLTMRYTEIRNMAAFGVIGRGFSNQGLGSQPALLMENSIVQNCGRTLAIEGGGNFELYNCTFDNSRFFGRRDPQVFISNYLFTNKGVLLYPLRLRMVNSIVWADNAGLDPSEIELDFLEGQPFTAQELQFDHCAILYSPENEVDISPYLDSSLVNIDPLFMNTFLEPGDFRLEENSPMIDAGKDVSARYLLDFRGNPDSTRTLPFDIGAFEFIPQ